MWFMVALIAALIVLLIRFQQYTTTIFGGVLLTIFALGWITPDELLSNASNQGLATLVLLIILSYALEKTSLLTHLTRILFTDSERASTIRTIAFSGVSSAILNNTAVVAAMINTIKNSERVNASRLLLPMCFAATLGGTMTLIGTSTNLVINSMWVKQGHESIGFFDLTPIGIVIFVIGSIVLYFTSALLPRTEIEKEPIDEYLVEAEVEDGSLLAGKTVEEAGLRNLVDLFLVEIIRGNKVITPVTHYHDIQAGDKLMFSGDVKRIQVLQQFDGIKLFADDNGLTTKELTEVTIKQESNLVNQTLKIAGFRAKFDAAVVAVRRDAGTLCGKLGETKLRAGDILLLATGPDFSSRTNIRKNFFVLSGVKPQNIITGWREKLVIFGFIGMILLSVITGQPLFNLALYLLAALLVTGCIEINEVRQHFPISIWLIVVSALCLANAMSNVGLDIKISQLASQSLMGMAPSWTLLGIIVTTTIVTELLTNNAAAALMFPIAYSVAVGMGVDPYPMVLAVCFGASFSFMSPFGYQTNLMIFNTGIYSIKDYAKVGGLITIVVTILCVAIIPMVYPF